QALMWFRKAAETGNWDAIQNLIDYLEHGRERPGDTEEILKWGQYMVDRQMPEAEVVMGQLYVHSRFFKTDEKKSFEWFLRGAKRGDAQSQFRLAESYRDGVGADADNTLARQWFVSAADRGHEDAAFEAGWMFWNGIPPPQDRKAADKYLRQAVWRTESKAMLGMLSAQKAREVLDDETKRREESDMSKIGDRASRGSTQCMVRLGRYHLNGERGLVRDWVQAYGYFDRAASKGDPVGIEERARLLDRTLEEAAQKPGKNN
ncbi:MAG TPA: tetratricopeptide repeat protein, partial [Roseimicrobium sp.]|nr:tetratricopeptide repeat protein [Roseimicrobium sp.]